MLRIKSWPLMSVQDDANAQASRAEMSKVVRDQSFVSSILASLPGVDLNDPSVKDLLASLQGQRELDLFREMARNSTSISIRGNMWLSVTGCMDCCPSPIVVLIIWVVG